MSSKVILNNRIAKHVCTILINRPAKRNALDLETIKSLKAAIQTFEEDDNLYVAILGGVGGNFSSGYDLSELINRETSLPNVQQIEQMLFPIQSTSLSSKKITIAAIEGHAAGVAYELALKCDFRVADKDSRMGFMNRRFGIPIMNGGTIMLPNLIGQARANELIATGKAQLAQEALQYGVLTYISDIGCALGRALNLARCLAKFDQASLLNDLKSPSIVLPQQQLDLLRRERRNSLDYLKQCKPLLTASKFLNGELGRHGNFDMGNLLAPEPEVTL